MAANLVENDIELASLDWLQQLGYATIFGPHLGPDEPSTERASFSEVVLADRFRAALRNLNPTQKLKTKWAAMEAVVGAEKRIDLIAEDLVKHWEARLEAMDGKAMVVCMSRRICVELYEALKKLRPEWHHDDDDKGAIKVVMTGSADDGPAFAYHAKNKPRREELAKQFKNPAHPFKIVIVRDMPQKNLAIELLRKLLSNEIRVRSKKFLIQSKSFAEMLEQSIRKYQNRAIEAAAVIQELIELARQMREAGKRGENLRLTDDELAFYDALEVNDSAVKVLGEPTLKTIAQELVETIRNSVTIDWTEREAVRAKIRVAVKRILRKHGYPPDKQEKATQTVLQQAELLCADWAG